MKKLIFCFLFSVLICSLFAQQYGWIDISDNIPGTPDLSDLFFVSDNEGWITSSSQTEIYHTTDGGETFEIQTTQYTCNAIYMLNENEGYAGGAQGRVYRTTDGGENWIVIGSMGATLADISFPPVGGTGYCCGINGNIRSIDNTGVTIMTSNINGDLSSISFPVNSEEGWVCGGSVISTFFNGIWGGLPNGYPSGGYNAIYMVDTLNGWAVGDNGAIIHTTDGQNWATQQTNPAYILTDVFFINAQEGWAVGSGGGIFHTTNSGINWIIEGTELSSSILRDVHFTSSTNGYVVGNNKTLIKFGELTSTDGNILSVETLQLQNFPNPFNPETEISFHLSESYNVSLSIYNVKGQKIKSLLNEQKQAGEHSIVWDGKDTLGKPVSSGVYLYKLIVNDKTEAVKKCLLMK